MKRPDGVTIIALLLFMWAVLFFLGALILGLFGIPSILWNASERASLYFPMAGVILVMVLLLVGCAINAVAGWGLLALKGWARWLAIIAGILSLPAVPIGTVIGAFVIWYLMKEEIKRVFEE